MIIYLCENKINSMKYIGQTIYSLKKRINVISPNEETFVIYGLGKFAKENNLNKAGILYHIKNKTNNYKGWRFERNE